MKEDDDKKGPIVMAGEELHERMAQDFHQKTAQGIAQGSRSRSMSEAFKKCYGFNPLKKQLWFERRYFDVEPHRPTEGAVFDIDSKDIKGFYSEDQVMIIAMDTMAKVIDSAVKEGELDARGGAVIKSAFIAKLKLEMAYEFPVAFFILNKKKEKKDG